MGSITFVGLPSAAIAPCQCRIRSSYSSPYYRYCYWPCYIILTNFLYSVPFFFLCQRVSKKRVFVRARLQNENMRIASKDICYMGSHKMKGTDYMLFLVSLTTSTTTVPHVHHYQAQPITGQCLVVVVVDLFHFVLGGGQ